MCIAEATVVPIDKTISSIEDDHKRTQSLLYRQALLLLFLGPMILKCCQEVGHHLVGGRGCECNTAWKQWSTNSNEVA